MITMNVTMFKVHTAVCQYTIISFVKSTAFVVTITLTSMCYFCLIIMTSKVLQLHCELFL